MNLPSPVNLQFHFPHDKCGLRCFALPELPCVLINVPRNPLRNAGNGDPHAENGGPRHRFVSGWEPTPLGNHHESMGDLQDPKVEVQYQTIPYNAIFCADILHEPEK